MVNEREKLIGARLRAFREALQIPRSRFAVTIGFGSERLASYESGNAPLLYNVFRVVAQNFELNPHWLAGQGGSHKIKDIIDDAAFIGQIPPRALFSEIYDMHIADRAKKSTDDADQNSKAFLEHYKKLLESVKDQSLPIETRREINRHIIAQTGKYVSALTAEINRRKAVNLKLNEVFDKLDLTEVNGSVNNTDVTPKLPSLLKRLKAATSQRGKKSALAEFLGVSLVQVSQWLAGDREPGGETTLRLLHWVEQQERQK
jgi:transcriptional regulator with XRE-family HTH domain